jgi:predicted RNA-binding Zn-ribbon protein involved in translation (DUF1610 family)
MDEIPLPPIAPKPAVQSPTVSTQTAAQLATEIAASSTFICPQCHFPLKPEYYYCPNCGKNLRVAPLPTDTLSQVLLYAFSIILPVIAYLAISKWQGIKYIRSSDPQAKQMGYIALALLVISSIIMFWLTYVWIQGYVASSLNDVNNLGGLGGGSSTGF